MAATKKMDDVGRSSHTPENTSAPKKTSWHPNLKVVQVDLYSLMWLQLSADPVAFGLDIQLCKKQILKQSVFFTQY